MALLDDTRRVGAGPTPPALGLTIPPAAIGPLTVDELEAALVAIGDAEDAATTDRLGRLGRVRSALEAELARLAAA